MLYAAIAEINYPEMVTRSAMDTALPPSNKPIDSVQRELIKRAEQRLCADEAYSRWNIPEVVCTPGKAVEFNRGSCPYVLRPWQTTSHPGKPRRTLGQDLIDMPIGQPHRFEYTINVAVWNTRVE
jgi:hypothetical protein